MKHIGEEYTGENIVVSEENKFFEYTAKFISINKTPFVAYLNKDTLDLGERQPTYCFDSLGRPVLFTECLSSYCSNLSELLAGNYTVNRYPMTIWRNKNSSDKKTIGLCLNRNLVQFLRKNDIRLLDNSRLTIEKLPKSNFYLFVEWYWVYPEAGYNVLKRMDSICALNPEVTLVKVHNTNIKGTPVVLD
ncbi:MAG: hypothetical protein MJZ72_02320 [Bacteroidales bacterium]|nr:hypothetical protein [Bacteroidales bacterium]